MYVGTYGRIYIGIVYRPTVLPEKLNLIKNNVIK